MRLAQEQSQLFKQSGEARAPSFWLWASLEIVHFSPVMLLPMFLGFEAFTKVLDSVDGGCELISWSLAQGKLEVEIGVTA